MPDQTVGFIGLGRLGVPIVDRLLDAGRAVVCCRRGRSAEIVTKGAVVVGDGSPRAVAEAADVVFTCLPGGAVQAAFDGPDGLLAAEGDLPLVVELSVAPIDVKARLRARLLERGGDLLDCPVSGTPEMAAAGAAVIYGSGEPRAYARVAPLLEAISPGATYVGDAGNGMRMKYVANLLVLVHVAATAEAMAFATRLGLDLDTVVELVARSPAAASGQFAVRAPMIAKREFEGRLVDVRDAREVLEQVRDAARDVDAAVPLAATAKRLFDDIGERGDDDSDPGKLVVLLERGGTPEGWLAPEVAPADEPHELHERLARNAGRLLNKRLYLAMSKVNAASPAPPAAVILEHQAWAGRLERDGTLFAAGPLVDDDGAISGDGLYVVRADDRAHAAAVVADDPFHAGGYRCCAIHGWSVHQGAFEVSLNFSDGTYRFA